MIRKMAKMGSPSRAAKKNTGADSKRVEGKNSQPKMSPDKNKTVTVTNRTTRKRATTAARSRSNTPRKRSEVTYGDVTVGRGSGGETHQEAGDNLAVMTTQQGVPIPDDQNTLTVGDRGPQLLEDFAMREKIFHFDHERIPERVVHARGYGARGFFEAYDALPKITHASPFSEPGKKTEVFARFSTVAGSAGSADLARDARGFAVKFYTETGNWDLVGNNIPVFFIQDAMKFPDLIHSVKPEPNTGFPQAQSAHDNFWDFMSLMPEAIHMLLWTMSDRGIPRGFRFMEGFGVHTFRFINAKGASTYAKFHWKPMLGLQSVVWNEALKINGADPDFHRRDLWNAIESGDFPEWELGVQLFDDEFADNFAFDILDATKLIPEEEVPVRAIGKMVLNQNVDNFFAETEQVAFCTSNVIPGIDFTNDPLLQGRNFSYLDTQLKRLGSPNFTHIPVNAPRCPFAHFQQDGHMTTTRPTGRANYEPNSWGKNGGPRESQVHGYKSHASNESGDKRRVRAESFADHYSQARQFYKSQEPVEQTHLSDAITFELSKVKTQAIRERLVSHLLNVDKALGRSVADGLGFSSTPKPANSTVKVRDDLVASPSLSIMASAIETFKGRRVGALVCDGADAKTITALKRTLKSEGAELKLIAGTVTGICDSDGSQLDIDEAVDGGPSVLFDAIALILTDEGATSLAKTAAAKDFVTDAHAHKKFIAYTEQAVTLFDATGLSNSDREIGYHVLSAKRSTSTDFVVACRHHRAWNRK